MKKFQEFVNSEDSSATVNETLAVYAKQSKPHKHQINIQCLMDEGYMTLDQSKALVEATIHRHFHNS